MPATRPLIAVLAAVILLLLPSAAAAALSGSRYHLVMTKLAARRRAQLRDSAFAYIDPQGRRRLPIHDESHVRNALARFNQVAFESDEARAAARTRLLRAAKRYGIVPIGFVDGQLRDQGPKGLPTGSVTLLLTDIVDSTGVLRGLGGRYSSLLSETRRLICAAIRRAGGREVDARADEYFAAFKRPAAAMEAALAIQRGFRDHDWPDAVAPRLRIGIHSGRPTLTEGGYVGLAVHATSRICSMAHGGQIVLSRAALTAVGSERPEGATFLELGRHRLRGLAGEETLYQLSVEDLPGQFPRPGVRETAP